MNRSTRTCIVQVLLCVIMTLVIQDCAVAQTRLDDDGMLVINGQRRFILGCYHNPENAAILQGMARNGINLVNCKPEPAALDQAQQAGLYGWINLGNDLDLSENSAVRQTNLISLITRCKTHPALAVWEAPDEAVWNLSYPELEKKIRQPNMTEKKLDSLLHGYEQAVRKLASGFRQGIAHVKELDPFRPLWFNHAPRNGLKQLEPFSALADIIGCDIYPVRVGHNGHSDLAEITLSSVGAYTDLMQASGPGKPAWMVLQAFSWEQLLEQKPERFDPQGFPSYAETRFMAYVAILHGAKGLLWWGSFNSSPQAAFWRAILAVTREIADLEPFLTSPELKTELTVVAEPFAASKPTRVAFTFRRFGNEYLLIVLPEDNEQYVRVSGLTQLDGRTFFELGTDQIYPVQQGRLLVSFSKRPHVLCTDANYVKSRSLFPDKWDLDQNHPLKEHQ